ncbi:hypothetical protein, partial [Rhodococcus sp. (in: high G+C Gram-positive bacteria)]
VPARSVPIAKPVPKPEPEPEEKEHFVTDRVTDGDYNLPPTTLLIEGDPPKLRSSANDAMIEAISEVLEQFK